MLWLLEELGQPYEVVRYERDPATMLAPASLKAVHPLGKSPVVVTDEGLTLAESCAIIETLAERYGPGKLAPVPGTPEAVRYRYWLHYAEGSAMLPLMLLLYVMRLGDAGAPLHPRIEGEIANHLGYVDQALSGREYLVGEELPGADIQMSFVAEVAKAFGKLPAYPNLAAWIDRLHARPAWQRALEKGGPYMLGR